MKTLLAIGSLGLLAACSSAGAKPSTAPPVFGGQGAVIGAPKEQALPDDSALPKVAGGPCAAPSPASDVALVDDFEDGDAAAFKGFQREGWWWGASDGTEGAKLYPERGTFRPERLPTSEATRDNLFAAHFKAEGQKEWGAVWGVTMRWENKGIRCPLNVSAFAGLRFRAKGPGVVRLAIGMPETQTAEGGGTCTSGCFDMHGKVFFLSDHWDDFLLRWDHVEQQGWGTQARFDPARIVSLQFAVKPPNLPADFWVDDIAYVTEPDAAKLAAAIHAEPVAAPAPPPTTPHSPLPAGKATGSGKSP